MDTYTRRCVAPCCKAIVCELLIHSVANAAPHIGRIVSLIVSDEPHCQISVDLLLVAPNSRHVACWAISQLVEYMASSHVVTIADWVQNRAGRSDWQHLDDQLIVSALNVFEHACIDWEGERHHVC